MEQFNKKVSNKAFIRLVVTLFIAVTMLITCFLTSTWAWFASSDESGGNVLKTGECKLQVAVTSGAEQVLVIDNFAQKSIELEGEYLVTLTLPKNSASGYLLITANSTAYYTDCLLEHNLESPVSLSFTIKTTEKVSVTFTPRWGIYSNDCNVFNGDVLAF
jgi:hypothetical protein